MNILIVAAPAMGALGAFGLGWTMARLKSGIRESKICLSSPGTNSKGQWLVDLNIDRMGFGYIVLDDGYTVDELAEALHATVFSD